MNVRSAFPALLLISCAVLIATAQANTLNLGVSANPVTYGSPLTLTATFSTAPPSGPVTFYDGVNVIGTAPIMGTTATLTTRQLFSGTRKLSARGGGAIAPVVLETVSTLSASGFNTVATFPVGPPVVAGQPYAAEQSPAWVAVGDFNNDGKLDTVLPVYSAATGATSEISILLGNGNGTFQAAVHVSAGTNIFSVAVGDFNGDGKADLILADGGSSTTMPVIAPSINVMLGNGNGTFLPPTIFPIPVTGDTPSHIIVGDFNLDGKEDVAVSNTGSADVTIFLGNGNGTFGTGVNYSTGTQVGAFGLALGDYNGDGIPDLAVVEDVLVILLGNGDGTFHLGSSNMTGNFPIDVQTGDFNNDGKADLAVASFTDNQVTVLLGNGNGTFVEQPAYNVGTNPESITVADLNGDGKQDLAVANSFILSTPPMGSVSVLTGNGDGTFQPQATYATGLAPVAIAQGDFTGQGTVDLVTADYGDGTGTNPGDLGVLTSTGCVASISANAPTSFDSNGTSFIVTVNAISGTCSWTATAPSWAFLSTTGGTGYSQIAVQVAQNTTGADRAGTLNVGGRTLNLSQAFTSQVFGDVPPSAYYFDAVNLLSTKGITAGCGTNVFCPGSVITRDQMAIFIVRSVYGSDNFTVSPVQHFADVSPSTFGYQWIQKMYELGISAGCGNGNYCPTSQVTRDQMAIFIIRARYGANTQFGYSNTPVFNDVPNSEFAFKWIQRMSTDGITAGCGPALYCPSSPVTRGDMAIFVMRGAFNQILVNPGAAMITSVSPNTLAPGASATFTVNGVNTTFIQGVTVVFPVYGFDPANGITAGPVTVTGPSQFTVTLTASPLAPTQPYSIYVQTNTTEAVLPNAVVVP